MRHKAQFLDTFSKNIKVNFNYFKHFLKIRCYWNLVFQSYKNFFKTSNQTPILFSSDEELKQKIPNFVQNVRHAIKALKEENPTLNFGINLIIHGMEKFIIEKNILQYQVDQLQEIIVNEKKQQKWNKNISLFIKNELEQIMFFFPSKIAVAKTRQKKLNTQKKKKVN